VIVQRNIDQLHRAVAVTGELRFVVGSVLPVAVQEYDQREFLVVFTAGGDNRAVRNMLRAGRPVLGEGGVFDCRTIRTREHRNHSK